MQEHFICDFQVFHDFLIAPDFGGVSLNLLVHINTSMGKLVSANSCCSSGSASVMIFATLVWFSCA